MNYDFSILTEKLHVLNFSDTEPEIYLLDSMIDRIKSLEQDDKLFQYSQSKQKQFSYQNFTSNPVKVHLNSNHVKVLPKNKWVQEWNRGCILCALINAGYVNDSDIPEFVKKYQGEVLSYYDKSFETYKQKLETSLGLSELWINLGGIDPIKTSGGTFAVKQAYLEKVKECTESNFPDVLRDIYHTIRDTWFFSACIGNQMDLRIRKLNMIESKDDLISFFEKHKICVVAENAEKVCHSLLQRIKNATNSLKDTKECKLKRRIDVFLAKLKDKPVYWKDFGQHFIVIDYTNNRIIDSMMRNIPDKVQLTDILPINTKGLITDTNNTLISNDNLVNVKKSSMYKLFDAYVSIEQ